MPKYPFRTEAPVRAVDGVRFLAWKIAMMRFQRRSEDGRAYVQLNIHRDGGTYSGYVDGIMVGDRFRTEQNAMKACVRFMRKTSVTT